MKEKENSNINKRSWTSKILETFVVTFLGTVGGAVGSWVNSESILIIATFSALAGIGGILICEYIVSKEYLILSISKWGLISKDNSTKVNRALLPYIITGVIFFCTLIFKENINNILAPYFINKNPKNGPWIISLILLGALGSAIIFGFIHIKEVGVKNQHGGSLV